MRQRSKVSARREESTCLRCLQQTSFKKAFRQEGFVAGVIWLIPFMSSTQLRKSYIMGIALEKLFVNPDTLNR